MYIYYIQATSKLLHNTMKNSSLTLSNLIGPVEKMALANHPVNGLYFTASGLPQVDTYICNIYIYFFHAYYIYDK